ncbi:putative lipid-transfer protein DIR1 [Humulus lupulus]|uniref:putative lipid-transfer protein DIR1 n=1 Tax=Humulus lupulus TaxID=3486 RepID=UPI002B4101E2|nr:putative lipid-transfer protein DIR1 [Humulus lupulus]
MNMECFPRLVIVALLVVGITTSINVELSYAQTICKVPMKGLMECKPAVTKPNPKSPTPECCSALTHADLQCLCSYKNSQLLPSLGIDPTLALQLPQKCNLPHPANC